MSLTAGTKLGPYEIVGALGSGGMGEVYKGRDTRLDRTVAIKVLPAQLHLDLLARERLEREARVISALNHPRICTLHDIGNQDGVDFLVMEYVEGETLAARLVKGPLPLEQALQYAIDLASALDRAHRSGIVHRDIKPGNVMVNRAGIKLLDFGLARVSQPVRGGGEKTVADLTNSGVIVGTVQYMAPEQIDGGTIDARTDIFAFGALLYEMVSGRKAFEGASVGSIVAAIVERDPPRLSSVQPLAPAALDRVVATCLAKDPDDRWQTARDLMRELQWVAESRADSVGMVRPMTRRRTGAALAVAIAMIGIAAAAAAFVTIRNRARDVPSAVNDVRFSVYPEAGSAFATSAGSVVAPQFALSPDGRNLVFVATSEGRNMLWARSLDALAARAIVGTEDAADPFWSADSRSVMFFSQGKLKSVSLDGGMPVARAEASRDTRGGAWAPDGTVLIARTSNTTLTKLGPDGSIRPVFATANTANAAATVDRWAWVLPDGRHFVFVHRNPNPRVRGLYLATLEGDSRTRLTDGDWGAVAIGEYLLFLRGRTLMAQTLSVADRRLTGEPVVLLDNVAGTTTGYMAASVSQNGSLAYAQPWPTSGEIAWFARDGRQLGPAIAPLADYVDFALSPDGTRVAFSLVDARTNTGDVWLFDTTRRVTTRLTSDAMNDAGVLWSPDSARVIFRSNRAGFNNLFSKGVDDARPEELLFDASSRASIVQPLPTHYSRDGAHIILTNTGAGLSYDVWDLPTASAAPRVLVETMFDEYHGELSPDSRWLAYVSEESGVPQVYVQSFPEGEQRVQVSSRGGTEPKWRKDGRELYFLGGDRMLMATPVVVRPTFTASEPVALFQTRVPIVANPFRRHYDVSPDGLRFLVNTAPVTVPTPAIHVVLDWRALLTKQPN